MRMLAHPLASQLLNGFHGRTGQSLGMDTAKKTPDVGLRR
jgi:hypothetical protein